MRTKTEAILLHHTAGNEKSMEALRSIFKSRFGVNYVGYNLVIFPDGSVESDIGDDGVGVHNATGKYTNVNSLGVSLVGDFSSSLPGASQLEALVNVLDRLVSKYKLPKTQIFGHRDLKSTACPGEKLYAWLQDYKKGELVDVKEERVHARADAMRFAWESWNPGKKADMDSIYKEAEAIENKEFTQKSLMKVWKDDALDKRNFIKPSEYTKRVNELKKQINKLDKENDYLAMELGLNADKQDAVISTKLETCLNNYSVALETIEKQKGMLAKKADKLTLEAHLKAIGRIVLDFIGGTKE